MEKQLVIFQYAQVFWHHIADVKIIKLQPISVYAHLGAHTRGSRICAFHSAVIDCSNAWMPCSETTKTAALFVFLWVIFSG